MEVNDNVLSLLKQAFYFSLNSVNDAIAPHGVTTAQIGLMRYLANEPGLSGAELARRLLITPQGVQLALTALGAQRAGRAQARPPARAHPAGLPDGPGTRRGLRGESPMRSGPTNRSSVS